MSWSRIKATGAGQFDWRVIVAGYPTEFVSSEDMEMIRPSVTGESGWSASNYYSRADGDLEGGDDMVRAVMFRLDATPAGDEYLFSKGNATSAGWSIRINASRVLTWRVAGNTATHTFAADDVGKTHLVVATNNGTNLLLYVNGTLEDTQAAPTYGENGEETNIGAVSGGGSPADSATILACAASDSVSTVGDADSYWTNCKTAGTLVSFTGIEHLWRTTSPSSLASDLVGSVPMTLNGSLTSETFKPDYDGEDGRERICCLERGRDLVIEEHSNPIDVIPQTSSVSVILVDTDEAVTACFAQKPSKRTWLSTDLTRGGTSMGVLSEDGWVAGDYAHIGLEATKVTTTSTGTLTVDRGQWDTTDVAHYTEDGVETRRVEVTDVPRTTTGRRVLIYAYGEGDGKQGEGTLVWAGIAAREPELQDDGVHWNLTVENTARLLSQTLGSQLGEPLPVRGIFYHAWCNLSVEITEYGTDEFGGAGTPTTAHLNLGLPSTYTTSGDKFFASQEEFLEELNSAIDSAISAASFSSTPVVRAVPDGEGWTFQVTPDSTGTRYISVLANSPVDGSTWARVINDSGERINTVTGGTTYRTLWRTTLEGSRTVPRGGFGPVGFAGTLDGLVSGGGEDIWRLYVGSDASLASVDAIIVEWPQAGDAPSGSVGYFVNSVDTTNRYLQITPQVEPDGVLRGRVYTAALRPKVQLTRTLVQDGHFGDLIQALVDDGRDEYARFGAPFITINDFDTASFDTAVLENAAGRGFVLRRHFMLGAEVELSELIKHEARMCGAILLGFNDGLIEATAWHMPVSTDPDVVAVTLLNSPNPTWQQYAVGSVKGAIFKTGYNPFEDDWTGTTFPVIDVVAQSRNPLAAMVEIEPRSVAATPRGLEPITAREAEDLMELLVGAYGYPYSLVRLDVPFTALDGNVRLGTDVSFTPNGRELPDTTTGTRDPAQVVGKVIGRRLDFQTARISLELFVPGEDYAGYSPAHYISDETNTAGDTWDLTVTDTDPFGNEEWGESTDVAEDFLSAGDKVEVYQWGVASPTVVTGDVDSISGNAATVTFDSTWTPGTDEWVLRGQGASTATTNQQLYVHFGGEDGRIAFSTARVAWVFSP